MRIPLLAVSILSLATTACGAPPASAAPEPQLKTYAVPAGYGPEIQSILNNAMNFAGPDKVVGRAQVTPNGQLVVVAPAAVQDGVKSLLDGLANGAKPAPPASVEITYWLVDGKRASGAAKSTAPAELQPALDAITKADGAMSFGVVEKLQLTTNADERGEIEGVHAMVAQKVSVLDGSVVADLELDHVRAAPTAPTSHLSTRVRLAPSQLLVLGQYGEPEGDNGTLYYIARADLKSSAP